MIEQANLQYLSAKLSQPLVLPSDADYDKERLIWNGMVDKRPAMIARCKTAEDVVSCVKFARQEGLTISIKGGGHGVAGKAVCNDGLMISLTQMKEVSVNPEEKTVTAQPGLTIAELDEATQKHGLATPMGIVSKTGIAGLTLGGGLGYLGRKYGLSVDNLIAVELVTASGDKIQASEQENPDLFWALRGGGGNFGIVTSFTYRLHPVGPEVMTAQAFYPIEKAEETLKFYRELTKNAPDELAVYALVVNVPPVAPFPEDYQGKPAVALVACHCGNIDDGKKALRSIEAFGDPIFRFVGPMPFTQLQQSFDAGSPERMRYYWKAHYMAQLSDEAIHKFAELASNMRGALTVVGFEPFGGAISRVDESATAFPQRQASNVLGIWSGWTNPEEDEAHIAWTRNFHDQMAPYAIGGVYSNYLDQDDDHKIPKLFGDNYARLQKIKNKYDPENFFSINQNIVPAV